jgi:glycosyltransferase involved in cell wall biosynthesis
MNVVLVWHGPEDTAERAPLACRQVPLLARLAAQGIAVAVVLLGDGGGLRSDLEAAGIPVDVLQAPLGPRLGAVAHLPGAVLGLQALLRRHDPDVIEGDEPMPAIATGLAARGRRRGVIVYRRHHHGGRARLLAASRLAARLADRTIVSCEAMRQRAADDDGTSLARIDIAASGAVDWVVPAAADVAGAREGLGIPPAARVVGVVSRLRWEKGIDILIDALDHIGEAGEVHAVVIGTGPEQARLRQLAARCRTVVHFLGHRHDVSRWLAMADVIAMPSRREAFGRVALEAMAAGRPLVVTRVGGLAEVVVDQETGLIVPPENPYALAAALGTILGDHRIARRLGEAGRRRYEAHYTLDHMASAWRGAWERAATRGGVC